jgi:hypothetical protein
VEVVAEVVGAAEEEAEDMPHSLAVTAAMAVEPMPAMEAIEEGTAGMEATADMVEVTVMEAMDAGMGMEAMDMAAMGMVDGVATEGVISADTGPGTGHITAHITTPTTATADTMALAELPMMPHSPRHT